MRLLLFVQRQAGLGAGAQPRKAPRRTPTGLEPEPTPLATVAAALQQPACEEADRGARADEPRHRPQRPVRCWIRRRGCSDEALVEAPRQVPLRGREPLELPADALDIRRARGRPPLRERAHLLAEVMQLVEDAPWRRARRLAGPPRRLGRSRFLGQMLRPHVPYRPLGRAHLPPA